MVVITNGLANDVLKAVIIIGGPQKGTRFRPLSLDYPKPLFPIGGLASIQHHIEALVKVPGLKEILLVGFYQPSDHLASFTVKVQREFPDVNIRYLQEYAPLGTAGGIYHFRDQILLGGLNAFFVLNADVCGDFPLAKMVEMLHDHHNACCLMLTTEATRDESLNYGCVAIEESTAEILHYVEKPTTFLSKWINCGVYLMATDIFNFLADVFKAKTEAPMTNGVSSDSLEAMCFEKDVFPRLAASGTFYAFKTDAWWSQLKTASAAIYANRHYLHLYRKSYPERLAVSGDNGPTIIGDVFIHPSAQVDPTAVIGPNVSIGNDVKVSPGVRIKEAIILDNVVLHDNSCVMYSVIARNAQVGQWCRVEGTPDGPNPNIPFAKLESKPLFLPSGKLTPSVSVIGCNVVMMDEVMLMNSIVLPHKELSSSYKNQIIL
ncbi:nucleotidyl transferase [Trichuris suis]|uniref:Uncharacterized protein n=1 Tax=Trichuris suis TaxID=68888 RepID=A0A085MNM3_9BILA|nr:hypothetical protein M513_00512 [Trichuris suis]KHJ47596.1 nucleotidyl transferase [Trichuris suis]